MIRVAVSGILLFLFAACSDPTAEANRQAVQAAAAVKSILEMELTTIYDRPLPQLLKERDAITGALATAKAIKEKYPQTQAAVALSGEGSYAGLNPSVLTTRLLFYPGGPRQVLPAMWHDLFNETISIYEVAWAYSRLLISYRMFSIGGNFGQLTASQNETFSGCFAKSLTHSDADLMLRHWIEMPQNNEIRPTIVLTKQLMNRDRSNQVSLEIREADKDNGDLLPFLIHLAKERSFNPYSWPGKMWENPHASPATLQEQPLVAAWRAVAHKGAEWSQSLRPTKERPFLLEETWLGRMPGSISKLQSACLHSSSWGRQ